MRKFIGIAYNEIIKSIFFNNIVTFNGVVIDKDKMTNEKETFGNHIFVGNSINKVVKIVDDKYIIFEEYDLSMNLDDEFTYSFEFDEIGFIFDNKAKTKKFYKHLLLDTYYKERINVSPYLDNGKTLYKYRLQLFSEAKRLETIQLPNISITQPVKFGNKKTKTVYYYIKQFVNMYSPKIKVDVGDGKWQYLNKYYLDPKLKEIFGNVYSPSFSLNNPNLRDVLKNLMLVKDQIPIVIDDMISCLDVTKRNGIFEEKGILSVVSSLNSENYCDSLKRTYNNALSQENTCKSIEFLNFRNSDTSLLTLDNMRLETRFPIYKINKIYMCYFKKNTIKNVDENGILENGGEEKIFLCQQDITPLVKLNSERQLLKKDWNEFENNYIPLSIEDISQYRVATIGYDIGSKYITGWGEKYNYIRNNLTWFRYNKTYIQNILSFVDAVNPYGDKEYYMLSADETNKIVIPGQVLVDVSSEMNNFFENIFGDVLSSDDNDFINPFSNMSLGLKSLFFKIEYEGFYNGTIIHSKNNGYSDITINDNSSASLTLLEKDGLFQKEKINRFSNEQVTIQARYTDINDVQSLGSVYNDDIIIYHREISVFDNVILATYYGTKDYVLKNYFTTVFAKHRPYNLLPYEESVIRAENKKVFLNFSKDKLLYEKNKTLNFKIENILNFFKANTNEKAKYSNELLLKNEQINAGYMKINGEKYASDVNTFVSGNSLCLNMAMYDNVSGGVYIKEKEPDISLMFDDVKEDFTGSVQDWYITVDDVETGSLKNIGFYFSHNENNFSNQSFEESFIIDTFYKQIFELPKITTQQNQETNLINGEFEMNKDNKELIDMTFQFEPISITNDVFFSQWMMKLNNLVGVYNKIDAEKIEIKDKIKGSIKIQYLTTTIYYTEDVTATSTIKTRTFPFVMLKINKDVFEKVKNNQNLELRLFFEDKPNTTGADGSVVIEDDVIFKYNIRYKQIKEIATDYITVDSTENIKYSMNYGNEVLEKQNDNKEINFKKTKYFCGMDLEEVFGENSYYFVNMDFQIKKISSSQGNWDYAVLSDDELLQQNLIKIDGINSNFLAYSDKEINAKTLIDSGSQAWEEIDKNGTTKLKYTSSSINISEYNVDNSVTDEYPKNMFIVLSDQPMKEHLVYDEYEDISEVSGYVLTDYKVGDIISLNDKSGPHINVNLNVINETDYQSVQMWYYVDGSYKFVFGVNATEDDKKIGDIKIYVSTISNKDPRVFDSNGLLVGEVVNYLEEDINYGEEQYFKKK